MGVLAMTRLTGTRPANCSLRRILTILAVSGALSAGACSSLPFIGGKDEPPPGPAQGRPALASPAVKEPVKPVIEVKIPTATQMSGKDAAFLLAHFGEPDLKRKERGAEFWTYMHRRCSVFFILYDEGEGAYTVYTVEVERHVADLRSDEEQLNACLSDIAYAHQAPEQDSEPGM